MATQKQLAKQCFATLNSGIDSAAASIAADIDAGIKALVSDGESVFLDTLYNAMRDQKKGNRLQVMAASLKEYVAKRCGGRMATENGKAYFYVMEDARVKPVKTAWNHCHKPVSKSKEADTSRDAAITHFENQVKRIRKDAQAGKRHRVVSVKVAAAIEAAIAELQGES